jgi:dTDP-4-dehydrorhamnose reductase
MQRILITGNNGLLGQKLVYLLLERNKTTASQFQITATSRGENRLMNKKGYQYFDLDITNIDEVARVFTLVKPHIIINTAEKLVMRLMLKPLHISCEHSKNYNMPKKITSPILSI